MFQNTMATNFFIIWAILDAIAVLLISFRSDNVKLHRDFWFITEKGSTGSKIFMFLSLFILLPFTIFYSIRNILNK
jgi:hypothetical protein